MDHKTGLQIVRATVGVEANHPSLLPRFPLTIDVPSLLTDFRDVTRIPYSRDLDGQIRLENTRRGSVRFSMSGRRAVIQGPLLRLERDASDIRYSLWGNQGFLYRFVLALLEERCGIFSFHACGLADEDGRHLYVIAGGAGSGKTVYLLSGISRGLKVFSTETVHFRFGRGGLTWFKGSLVDNIRVGTLLYDFPEFRPPGISRLRTTSAWRKKIALDLSAHQSGPDTLRAPRVVLVFPRIEEGRRGFTAEFLSDKRKIVKAVFDNLSQKIAETTLLYDRVVVPGLDSEARGAARLGASRRLATDASLVRAVAVLSNPSECWGDLLQSQRIPRGAGHKF